MQEFALLYRDPGIVSAILSNTVGQTIPVPQPPSLTAPQLRSSINVVV